MTKDEALKVDVDELKWLLKGQEVRTTSKFKSNQRLENIFKNFTNKTL